MVTVDSEQPVIPQEKVVEEDVSFKIASQIEYYFADVNLRKDKFMKEEMAKDDGWVPIETLLTFNRMKALTQDPAVVVTALRTPHPDTDQSIEVSENEKKIRRKVPYVDLTEEQVAELNSRTIHFKGITQDATLDEIRAFCSQYGKVVSIEMRRMRDDRKFKGCVMCVYATKQEADAALAGKEVYDENLPFMRENKETWQERKDRFAESRKNRKGKKDETGGSDVKVEEDENEDPVKVKSSILVLEGVAADVKFETIKSFFKEHGSVAYVDTEAETKRAYIRFMAENEAVSALKTASLKKEETPVQSEAPENGSKSGGGDAPVAQTDVADADVKVEPITEQEETADGKSSGSADDEISVEINGTKYKAFVLTGEEEIAHWKNVNKVRKQAALNNPKGDHRSGSRRGRGFKRGGKGYQGRNDRSDSKRKPRDGDGSGNKRIKAE